MLLNVELNNKKPKDKRYCEWTIKQKKNEKDTIYKELIKAKKENEN